MKKFPNALIIMLGIILFAYVLTYLIPQGQYDRVWDPDTNRTLVVSGSYHAIDSPQLGLFEMLLAIPEGLIGRADVIVIILLCGGCFYVIDQTGALKQGLIGLTTRLKGKEELALIAVGVLFATGGALTGLQEEVIAMTPALLLFTRGLGYNAFVAVASSFGSAVLGSAFSPINPFAVVIAQKEAELALLSGAGYRMGVFLVVFAVWMWFLIRYANRNRIEKGNEQDAPETLTSRSAIILGLLAMTFVVLVYGMLKLDWGFNEISAIFFVLGIAAGLIGKMGINGTSEAYIAGFKEMTFAAIIVRLAHSITLILRQGTIIDTIVYGLFTPMQYLPRAVSAVAMMVAHSVLHLPVPSTSGQAIMTMPILLPLSDLLGISRQICVLAYQYGAVIMDQFIPTNGALMAIIALAGISYDQWVKFIWKPLLIILSLSGISIVVALYIDYV